MKQDCMNFAWREFGAMASRLFSGSLGISCSAKVVLRSVDRGLEG